MSCGGGTMQKDIDFWRDAERNPEKGMWMLKDELSKLENSKNGLSSRKREIKIHQIKHELRYLKSILKK